MIDPPPKPPPPPTPKPKPLLCSIVYESDLGGTKNKCPFCGSSQKFKWLGFGKSKGCINPNCRFYYPS